MFARARGSSWSAVLALALVVACKSTKQEELENVAKDWCATIRASQVMPVYPLTQDIQPGDVFLVQLPIDQQQQQWRSKGYLPLDNHLARLDVAGYAAFYKNSFPLGEHDQRPLTYINGKPAWDSAPHAGFPTYSFSIKKGGGLNLALPISGVPVGLGLLGADAAEGSVSIGKARTLGVDIISLDEQLRAWASEPKTNAFLVGLASTAKQKNYVRVVTRVYLTGQLDVSLRDSTQRSAGVDAGVPSPAAMLTPKVAQTTADTPQAAADNYEAAMNKLNEMLKAGQDGVSTDATGKQVVGGSLRLTSATARAISLKEDFDPPLVLGYLGFDCQIRPGGTLGPAVPTYAVVSGALPGEAFLEGAPIADAYLDQFWVSNYQIAKQVAPEHPDAQKVVDQLDGLSQFVPASWDMWSYSKDQPLTQQRFTPTQDMLGYELFRTWRGQLETSIKRVEAALSSLPIQLKRAEAATAVEVKAGTPEAAKLAEELKQMRAQLTSAEIEKAHADARRALADWMFANLYAPKAK